MNKRLKPTRCIAIGCEQVPDAVLGLLTSIDTEEEGMMLTDMGICRDHHGCNDAIHAAAEVMVERLKERGFGRDLFGDCSIVSIHLDDLDDFVEELNQGGEQYDLTSYQKNVRNN